jgi:hypothetical protein
MIFLLFCLPYIYHSNIINGIGGENSVNLPMNDLNILYNQLPDMEAYHPIRIYTKLFHKSQNCQINVHELLGSVKNALSLRTIHDLSPGNLLKASCPT